MLNTILSYDTMVWVELFGSKVFLICAVALMFLDLVVREYLKRKDVYLAPIAILAVIAFLIVNWRKF